MSRRYEFDDATKFSLANVQCAVGKLREQAAISARSRRHLGAISASRRDSERVTHVQASFLMAETQDEKRQREANERAAMKILIRGRMQLFQVSPPVSQSVSQSVSRSAVIWFLLP